MHPTNRLPNLRSRAFAAAGVATLGLSLLMAIAPAVAKSDNANSGTVKVHAVGEPADNGQDTANDPHVCQFWLGFYFAPDDGGTWNIQPWSDGADAPPALAGSYDTVAGFASTDALWLAPGHYKLFWLGSNDHNWKHKAFWVDSPCPDPSIAGSGDDPGDVGPGDDPADDPGDVDRAMTRRRSWRRQPGDDPGDDPGDVNPGDDPGDDPGDVNPGDDPGDVGPGDDPGDVGPGDDPGDATPAMTLVIILATSTPVTTRTTIPPMRSRRSKSRGRGRRTAHLAGHLQALRPPLRRSWLRTARPRAPAQAPCRTRALDRTRCS